ncbi:MAG: hypothetical protein K6F51_15625 [Acetatifactor sp.]|nr:hypothetical protein [Acetatifactor sp.]
MAQKITCPVCFTKMNSVGHDLVCPECGYKYCEDRIPYVYDDHNHNSYESYNKKTSYSTGYTSSQGGKSSSTTYSSSKSTSGSAYSSQGNQAKSTYSSQGNQARSTYSSQSKQTSSGYGKAATQTFSNALEQRRQASSSAYQHRSSKKKISVGKFLFIIFVCYFIIAAIASMSSIFKGFFGDRSDIMDFFRNFSTESESSASERKAGKDETDSPAKESYPIVNVSHVTPDYVLSTFQGKTAPETFLQELLCQATSKTIGEVTADDCLSITEIYYFPTESVNYGQYSLADGTTDIFEITCAKFDSSELCLFGHLQVFIAEGSDVILSPGDLLGLNDLYVLGCSNTPVELLSIVDTRFVEYLFLTTEGDLDVRGIEEFPSLQFLSIHANNLLNEDYVSRIPNLKSLTITVPGAPIDYSFLKPLSTLEQLTIEAPFFTDLNFLEGMPHLISLEILGNGMLTDISALTSCPDLSLLTITDADLVQDFSVIGKLENLNYLELTNCRLSDLSWASSLTELVNVHLERNILTSLAPLENLPNLKNVFCADNPIEDYGKLDDSLIKNN